MRGQVICIISTRYTVRFEDGTSAVCIAMGKLRQKQSPVVGDEVEVIKYDDVYGIEKLYPRKNYLIRPLIANVDQAIIVMSCKDPDFSTTLIDRLIFLISNANIKPVLVITKTDLLMDEAIKGAIEDYKKGGYEVILTSKQQVNPELFNLFKGKVSVLTGQSGAGKSSLLNALDINIDIQTQEISKALGRGKHTTRHVELLEVCGGWIADTPGFSSLDFTIIEPKDLKYCVPDFKALNEACRFNDCSHVHEPNCAIKMAVSENRISKIRYEHYLECLKLCKEKIS